MPIQRDRQITLNILNLQGPAIPSRAHPLSLFSMLLPLLLVFSGVFRGQIPVHPNFLGSAGGPEDSPILEAQRDPRGPARRAQPARGRRRLRLTGRADNDQLSAFALNFEEKKKNKTKDGSELNVAKK